MEVHSSGPLHSEQVAQEIPQFVAEVAVSTATAIIALRSDPYMVLVADSEKHPKPILPGGKMELSDVVGKGVHPGLNCIEREVPQEIKTPIIGARLIGVALDPERDVRYVPVENLAAAVVSPQLSTDYPEGSLVKASYGCPDYIFTGVIDETQVEESSELKGSRFIDIRNLQTGDLSAGHDVIVLWYRRMLDDGLHKIPEEALQRFRFERMYFSETN